MGSLKVFTATFAALQVLREMGQSCVRAASHQPFKQTVRIDLPLMPAPTFQPKPIALLGHVREGKKSSKAHRGFDYLVPLLFRNFAAGLLPGVSLATGALLCGIPTPKPAKAACNLAAWGSDGKAYSART